MAVGIHAYVVVFILIQVVCSYAVNSLDDPISAEEWEESLTNKFLISAENNEVYLDWYNNFGGGYEKSVFLPSGDGNGIAIHWSIDMASKKLQLAVAARAKGWVGFGLAEVGGMPGSDIVTFTNLPEPNVVDAHVLKDNGMPLTDACQNWDLVRSQAEGEFIIFEAERMLDTGDPQDRPIAEDSSPTAPPQRIIAAWGDDGTVAYHGNRRVRGAIRFFGSSDDGQLDGDVFQASMSAQSQGSIDVTAEQHRLSGHHTEYLTPCFTQEHLGRLGLPLRKKKPTHIIGFEPIIDSAGSNLHHLGLVSYPKDNCRGFGVSVYIWAPGEGPLEMPPDVGASIGKGNTMSYSLHVHYNPTGMEGVPDSSGVRLHYTMKKRRHELGFLEIGDPLTTRAGMKVGKGLSRYSYDCPSSCSERNFDVDSVTVLREMLHMHSKGARMVNQQIREGEVIREAAVDHYDYHNAGVVSVMQESYEWKKGDQFRTTCYYDSDAKTTFGYETQNEMCIAFLLYYPKQEINRCGPSVVLPACVGDYERESLSSSLELERSFGANPEGVCDVSDSR